jgi:hypothetical protein
MEIQQQNNNIYMVVWAVLLLFIAWPLAWFIAPIWVVLLPFEAAVPPGAFCAGNVRSLACKCRIAFIFV